MAQLSASAVLMASSTAPRLRTGSAPGNPRQTGQTLVLGGAPKLVGQPQKILVRVASWTCTSRPITGSYRAITSGDTAVVMLDAMKVIIPARPLQLIKFQEHSRQRGRRGEQGAAMLKTTLVAVGIVVLTGCGNNVRLGPMEHETKTLDLDKSEMTRAELKLGAGEMRVGG